MKNRDLDSPGRSSSGSSGMGSSGMSSSRNRSGSSGREERMRNRSSSDMSTCDEDLQREQIEGNLGNEKVRGRGSDQ